MRCLYNNSTSQYIALAYGNEKAVGDLWQRESGRRCHQRKWNST